MFPVFTAEVTVEHGGGRCPCSVLLNTRCKQIHGNGRPPVGPPKRQSVSHRVIVIIIAILYEVNDWRLRHQLINPGLIHFILSIKIFTANICNISNNIASNAFNHPRY